MTLKPIMMMVLLGMLCLACAYSGKMNNIRLGMTRDEVTEVMGAPSSTSGKGSVMYLKYRLTAWFFDTDTYYVRLVDGSVDAYGRVGDFNLGY
jgi:hypothetical protein